MQIFKMNFVEKIKFNGLMHSLQQLKWILK